MVVRCPFGCTRQAWLVRVLEGYLACGMPGGGFTRLRCAACGKEEVVPFSCKGRGFCPSCGGRRMAGWAAHLVDPPPRRPLLTYHGVLAPAARDREKIVPAPEEEPQGESGGASALPPPNPHAPRPRSKRYYPWAQLLRRVFSIEVFCCPHCGGPRRLVAFLTEPEVIDRILEHLGIDPWPQPPPLPKRAG